MKILIFGNSFSVDATRYLHGISRAAGSEITVANLYIGGCSLARHYRNMLSGEPAYTYYHNGYSTMLHVTMKQMLLLDEWDYIVLQESSRKVGDYANFQPFLGSLATHFRYCCPKSQLIYNMSWTYPEGSRIFAQTPFDGPQEMYPKILESAERAAKDIEAAKLIPGGTAMWKLCAEIGEEAYRDGFHCNMGISRYMLGLLWFMALTGKPVDTVDYHDFDVEVTDEQIALAKRIATETAKEAGFLK